MRFMKTYTVLKHLPALFLTAVPIAVLADGMVYDTAREMFGTGDFDGDKRPDVVIVDKESGKIRLGYMTADKIYNWVDNRPSGVKGVAGFAIGKLFKPEADGFAFASPDGAQFSVVDVSSVTAPGRPVVSSFEAALGPNAVAAVDIGGAGNTPVADLYIGSLYNDPNQVTLLRNKGTEFPELGDAPLKGPITRIARVTVGGKEYVASISTEETADVFRVEDVSSGKVNAVLQQPGLPKGSEFLASSFSKSSGPEVIFYKAGESKITVRALQEAGGKLQLGSPVEYDLGEAVRTLATIDDGSALKLLAILGEGDKATVFNFAGKQAPAPIQTFGATNDIFTCGAGMPEGLVLFTQPTTAKYSSRYQTFKLAGNAYEAGPFGGLPTLADNDNLTIPDIHARIVKNLKVTDEKEMKLYTNTIPGTRVAYVMVPIKGGEFTMGSPDGEKDRKPDEGPQHKVKVSPFWMQQCEITWNEYELFMYPDEEKRTRATVPTDAEGDKLADAVTHPSRPYVEMSFGMGKDGYPAISMTQHAANKYCQWLSAKTGEFYRLPTEAEWEYAARAGTTTTYFFGDEDSKLSDYAWFEENSDFKYQKVGKKKANPWGLHDIYGNVVEWVLDQYDPEFYKASASSVAVDPWLKATKPYPHSVRGGSWDDQRFSLRSAARRGSDRTWKMQDPQLPKSIWYFSDAQFLGFRVVRPLKVPPPEELQKYWSSGVERD